MFVGVIAFLLSVGTAHAGCSEIKNPVSGAVEVKSKALLDPVFSLSALTMRNLTAVRGADGTVTLTFDAWAAPTGAMFEVGTPLQVGTASGPVTLHLSAPAPHSVMPLGNGTAIGTWKLVFQPTRAELEALSSGITGYQFPVLADQAIAAPRSAGAAVSKVLGCVLRSPK